MRRYYNNLCSLLVAALLLSILLDSCQDTWDSHYQTEESTNRELLLSKAEASSELSTFVGLLEKVGYDSVLLYPQAYTVFAPVNEAFDGLSDEVINDPVQLNALLGNHICRFSYTSLDADESPRIRMLNGKYEDFTISDGEANFGGAALVSQDIIAGNGILHTIGSLVAVKPNIWSYMLQSDEFPKIMSYLTPYNSMSFDVDNSVAIGKNTLGEVIYDSVFVASNSYFSVIGDLNSEENSYTFLGLPDDVYNTVYTRFEPYYSLPDPAAVTSTVDKVIMDNLVISGVSKSELTGSYRRTSTGTWIAVSESEVVSETKLSNGYLFVMNEMNLDPKLVVYKSSRFEVEDTEGRTIGKTSDLTIQKKYDISASGYFKNEVSLLVAPDASNSNNYFEVSFDEVASASYYIYIKFAPVGASASCELKYELSYSNMDGTTTTVPIEGGLVTNDLNERVKIGDTYTFPVYVNRSENSTYSVKLKVFVDVSDAELVLYTREFGIDYIELVPAQ
ncbi:fasciclin domain-containing protein [Mangrovibacterium sp.]|uniref:fasciclin domain-containing protein n=1 Tax=Mangrovibacterium sp. TaxID=1961364 RepID=UPI003568077D